MTRTVWRPRGSISDGAEVARKEFGVEAVYVDQAFPNDLGMVCVASIRHQRKELMRLWMLVDGREVIVPKQNGDRARSKCLFEMREPEDTQLGRILHVDEGLDGVDVLHQFLFLGSKGTSTEHTIFKLFLAEMKQLNVLVVLRYTA